MIRKATACLALAVLLFMAVSALELSGVTIDDLTGAARQAPAETPQPLTTTLPDATATPIRPAAQERQSDAERVTLYFRYHQTDYLGMEEREIPANGKRNVLLYVGNLAQNGITTSILNLLQHVDRRKYNFYINNNT